MVTVVILLQEIFAVKDGKSNPMTTEIYSKLKEFLHIYLEEKSKIEKELRKIRKSIVKLNEEIEAAQRNLFDVTNASSRQTWCVYNYTSDWPTSTIYPHAFL